MHKHQKKSILTNILKELPSNHEIQELKTFKGSVKYERIQSETTIKSVQPLQIEYRQLYEKIKHEINSQKQSFNKELETQISKFLETLCPKYQISDKFLEISEVERINFDSQHPKININTIQITGRICVFNHFLGNLNKIICDQASWSIKGNKLIEQCEDMLEKKLEWQGKIKIVGMSLDSQLQMLINRLNNNNWKKLEHFRFVNGYDDNNQTLNEINLQEVPFILIVDKIGQLVYIGSPANINIEEFLDNEIKTEPAQRQCSQKIQKIEIDDDCTQKAIQQFRQQTNSFQKLFSIIKEANFIGKVEVSLKKLSQWNQNTLKRVLLETKFELVYDVNKSEENKINQFLDQYWSQIPSNLKQVLKSKIRDPIFEQQEIKAKFNEIFSIRGVSISYYPQEILQLNYINGEFKTEMKTSFTALPQNLTVQSFTSSINEVKDFFSQFSDDEDRTENIESISQDLKSYVTLEPFQSFLPLHNYRKWGSEKYVTIEHSKGQILVLDYWAYACRPCVKGILHNAELIKKNITKWGNSVKFIALSIVPPDESQLFMDSNQELQKYLEFYFPKQVRQIDQILYGMQCIPHYLIIDKFGVIRYKGEVQNIEKKINKLIDEQKQDIQVDYQHELKDDNQIIQIITDLFQNQNIKENFSLFDKDKVIEFQIIITLIKIQNESKIQKTKLQYYIRDTQVEQFKEFLSQLFRIIPKQKWDITKEKQNTVSIKYPGVICAVCLKDISQQAQQYYSYFKEEHVCIECAEFDDVKQIGMERFKYKDTLIFINGPLADESVLSNIEIQKIGNNLKLKDGEIGNQKQDFTCYFCRINQPSGPRYISLNGLQGRFVEGNFIDYCQQCFTQIKSSHFKAGEHRIEKISVNTLFTRVLFNYGDYSEF